MERYGSFILFLHSHLPYVLDHGDWPHGMDWLNEAVTESYIPLLNTLYTLVEEGISPKLTIGITPVLTEQLASPSFKSSCMEYCQRKIEVAIANQREFSIFNDFHLKDLAKFWQEYYTHILSDFKSKYDQDIIGAFRFLQDGGHIEIVTSSATHAYLPLLSQDTSIRAQINQGIKTYKAYFGKPPSGFWLPECGYRPGYEWSSPLKKEAPYLRKGIEEFLGDTDIEYFVIDSHLLKGGKAIGVYIDRFEALKRLWANFERSFTPILEEKEKSPYELYLVGSEGKRPLTIFTRDPKTSLQVWSGEWGYPGDGWYLDFHKKHHNGGLRFWRVTSSKSDLASKWQYEPDKVEDRVRENASHFKELVKDILRGHYEETKREGVLISPFDTELFGHWWFEGIRWLYYVLKWVDATPEVELTTCREYLAKNRPTTVISIPEGSWGEGGFHWIWLNEWTEWTWRYIYEVEEEMKELAQDFSEDQDERLQSILRQLARELFLLQSSDWQFLISTWTARDYAEARISEHFENFKRLAKMCRSYGRDRELSGSEWRFLRDCERRNRVFPEIELEWFAR